MLAIVTACVFLMNSAHAFQSWHIVSARISYQLTAAKQILEGTTVEADGKGECLTDQCQFVLGIPLRSFSSGSRHNDKKIVKAVHPELYPIVSADCTASVPIASAKTALCALTLAGKSKEKWMIKLESVANNRGFTTAFEGKISLKEFEIAMPKIFAAAFQDEVKITGNILWKKENKFEF